METTVRVAWRAKKAFKLLGAEDGVGADEDAAARL
jgi:hypothetical protein